MEGGYYLCFVHNNEESIQFASDVATTPVKASGIPRRDTVLEGWYNGLPLSGMKWLLDVREWKMLKFLALKSRWL
eukprot:1161625-Pelagomonas_calceolata.AAC.18